MIKFKLKNEINNKEYYFNVDFKTTEDFFDWCEVDNSFNDFMEEMETGQNDWNGVHDLGGGIDDVEYFSSEIENFEKSLEKWKRFFEGCNKLIK